MDFGRNRRKCLCTCKRGIFYLLKKEKNESKLRWRTPLQATGYVRATAPNSVTGDNKPNVIWFQQKLTHKNWNDKSYVTIQPPPNQLDNIDFDIIGTSDY